MRGTSERRLGALGRSSGTLLGQTFDVFRVEETAERGHQRRQAALVAELQDSASGDPKLASNLGRCEGVGHWSEMASFEDVGHGLGDLAKQRVGRSLRPRVSLVFYAPAAGGVPDWVLILVAVTMIPSGIYLWMVYRKRGKR